MVSFQRGFFSIFTLLLLFFLSGFSFTNIYESQDCIGKGEGISLTPHNYFHPFHRHLDISRAITTTVKTLDYGSECAQN